jgi:hypothetical protein
MKIVEEEKGQYLTVRFGWENENAGNDGVHKQKAETESRGRR